MKKYEWVIFGLIGAGVAVYLYSQRSTNSLGAPAGVTNGQLNNWGIPTSVSE